VNVGDTGSPHGGRSQDFDINLAPIIDCFTVLISFMLISASFLAIGVFDANLATEGPPAANTPPPSLRVDVQLNPKMAIQLKVAGKTKMDLAIPATGEDWDLKALTAEIQKLKEQWPDTKSAVLNAADDVEYKHIVRVMETLKTQLPSILLGGL